MSKKGMFKFLTGLTVGAGLGILFAPKTGKKTRAELKVKLDELLAKIDEVDVEEVKATFTKKVEELKVELADLDQEKALKLAKKKAKELEVKANELVDYALEKGTPVLKETADVVRLKTVLVMKEVIKKLEEKGE